MMKKTMMILSLAGLFLLLSLAARPPERKKTVRTSPNYDVHISLDMTSPFVPDGRHSLADLSFKVVFSSVAFEFDPDEDPLLGRCQVSSGKGKGIFSVTMPFEGRYPEDRGTWRVDIRPRARKG